MRLIGVAVACVALAALPARAAPGAAIAKGKFEIVAPYNKFYERAPILNGPPFPVDAFLWEERPDPDGHFQVMRPPWEPKADAGWIYAKATLAQHLIAAALVSVGEPITVQIQELHVAHAQNPRRCPGPRRVPD